MKKELLAKEKVCSYLNEYGDNYIYYLFETLHDIICNYTGVENINCVEKIFECLSTALDKSQEVNRKIVLRKILKLDELIDRQLYENKSKQRNETNCRKVFGQIQEKLNQLSEKAMNKESLQYEFMDYVINEVRDLTMIEAITKKVPHLMNQKDKNGVSLFRNTLKNGMKSTEENDLELIYYYMNVLNLFQKSKNFIMTTKEKRDCMEEIYEAINKLSYNKKASKKNKIKIFYLNSIKDILQQEGKKTEKIEEIANLYQIPIAFDDRLISELNCYRPNQQYQEIDDYIITIDKENTLEIDDGVSCRKLPNGNFLYGVHISSVLGYYPFKSNVIQEALNRSHSIYLPEKYQTKKEDFNRIIPIFPYQFSTDQGSLVEGKERLCRSYYYEISKDGEIVNEKFLKTKIKSNKKCSFDEVNHIIQHGTDDKKLQETIQNLVEVTEILDKRYKPTELYEKIKENNQDSTNLRVGEVGAEKIVYKGAILTGNRVAEYFYKNRFPCLYRVHKVDNITTKKTEDMIKTLIDTYGGEEYKKLLYLINGIYPKSFYDISGRHDGLNVDHYCHITSELRRAPDIIVENGLEICYDKTPTDKEVYDLEEQIKKYAKEINEKNRKIDYFMEDYAKKYIR